MEGGSLSPRAVAGPSRRKHLQSARVGDFARGVRPVAERLRLAQREAETIREKHERYLHVDHLRLAISDGGGDGLCSRRKSRPGATVRGASGSTPRASQRGRPLTLPLRSGKGLTYHKLAGSRSVVKHRDEEGPVFFLFLSAKARTQVSISISRKPSE